MKQTFRHLLLLTFLSSSALASGLTPDFAQAKSDSSRSWPLVPTLFAPSNDRIYFIGHEVFFSDGKDTTVIDTVTAKYKRTLTGITYPLLVYQQNLFTIQHNFIYRVNIKSGKLFKIASIKKLEIMRFTGGSKDTFKKSTRVLLDFQAGDGIFVLSSYGMDVPAYMYGISIKTGNIIWRRGNLDNSNYLFVIWGVIGKYFLIMNGYDANIYETLTGKDSNISRDNLNLIEEKSHWFSGENDPLPKFCSGNNYPDVKCKGGKTMTWYQVNHLGERDFLITKTIGIK